MNIAGSVSGSEDWIVQSGVTLGVVGWLSDQWQFVVGTIIAILGIAIGTYMAWKPKRLDYAVVNDMQIIWRGARHISPDMSVRYAGRELLDPRLVTIRVRNTGKKAIRVEDFDGPFTFKYDQNGPFQARVARAEPANLANTEVACVGNGIAVKPVMINPRDWFDIQMLSDGPHGQISDDSRIADTRAMKRKELSELMQFYYNRRAVGTMFLSATIGLAAASVYGAGLAGVVVVLACGAVLLWLGLSEQKSLKR